MASGCGTEDSTVASYTEDPDLNVTLIYQIPCKII